VNDQERNCDHQAECRCVHRYRNTGRQQVGFLGRIRVGDCGKGLDQSHDGAEQAEQCRDAGCECDVWRPFLETRHDFHHALFHRDLDILTTAHSALQRQPHVEYLRDCRFILAGHGAGFIELAFCQQRLNLFPDDTILPGHDRQRYVAFDCDGNPDGEYNQDRVHEDSARPEETYNRIKEVHL
jgi:hypothetical protein